MPLRRRRCGPAGARKAALAVVGSGTLPGLVVIGGDGDMVQAYWDQSSTNVGWDVAHVAQLAKRMAHAA